MSPGALKGVSVLCFILCAVCLFVAYERYQDNASKVQAMNHMMGGRSSPLGDMLGAGPMEPAMPAATKYALLLAALTGAGGIVCLAMAPRAGSLPPGEPREPRPGGGQPMA